MDTYVRSQCRGCSATALPTGAPVAQAKQRELIDLSDPALAGQCIELHLHGWDAGAEIILTLRFSVNPQGNMGEASKVGEFPIAALYEKPPHWPPLRSIFGSAGGGFAHRPHYLLVGGYPWFRCVRPIKVRAKRNDLHITGIPITAMWTYPIPSDR